MFARGSGQLKTFSNGRAQTLPMLGKEAVDMAMVYATLIIKGRRAFQSVPETLKPQVREILIDCDCEHLCGTDEA